MLTTTELYNRAEELIGDQEQKASLDLLKCIQTYRVYPKIEDLLKHKPRLVTQLDKIHHLWKMLTKLNDEELSNLAIQLVKDIW